MIYILIVILCSALPFIQQDNWIDAEDDAKHWTPFRRCHKPMLTGKIIND